MLKNLIKTALRNIFKDFGYSGLNILGLTLGIASTLFLIIYIADELSYDNYHGNADRIFRVTSNIKETDDSFDWIVAQVPFAPQVKQDYPEIEDAIRFIDVGRALFSNREIEFYEEDLYYVDSTVFNVFGYKLIDGDPLTALTEPNTIVITKSFADKYFGSENPIGKTIDRPENEATYKITGVMNNVPKNSHFRFDGLVSRSTLPKDFGNSWGNFGVYTYLLLQEGITPEIMEEKLLELYEKFMASIFERMGITIKYSLMNIKEIHLKSTFQGEPEPTGSIKYVYIFGIVALFLLLVASMNYMNLATARSLKRAREVGLRKVVGSNRRGLIGQFLTESTALTIISLIISVILVFLLMPGFNNLAGKSFEYLVLTKPVMIFSIIGIIIFIGILGGSYPAFYLSKFNPVHVLKGSISSQTSSLSLRKALVVIQFIISAVMISCTWVVYNQLDYLRTKDLGYEQTNVLSVVLSTNDMINKYQVLRDGIMENPDVKYVSNTNTRIGEGSGKVIFRMESPEGMVERGINFGSCDHDFIKTMGITIIEGRGFQQDIIGDTLDGVLINEALAKRMNWDEPIGKKVELGDGSRINAKVIGLMKDYHQTGLYNEVESYMLLYRLNNRVVYIKLLGNKTQETLKFIEERWNEIFPEQPFVYEFLSNRFNEQFEADEKRGFIFTLFTVLTVIIACIGLYGLASYTVEQRTKEVGIRKVMGANEGTIVKLISKEFLILIAISILFATPIAYYSMQDWLQNYVYRTNLNSIIFILSAILTLMITMLTVSFNVYKAAIANPVESIQTE